MHKPGDFSIRQLPWRWLPAPCGGQPDLSGPAVRKFRAFGLGYGFRRDLPLPLTPTPQSADSRASWPSAALVNLPNLC